MNIVTRYAPSPTGNPHVGNIRTAIFAWLHTRSKKGKFLLRIEDTDRARFVPEAVGYIEQSLKWLGIDYDDEVIYQSNRLPVYKKAAEELIQKGHAYKCFCSTERLSELRKTQEEQGVPTGYDKKCRYLNAEEVTALEKDQESFVVRFAMPEEGFAEWNDLIRGKLKIEFVLSDDPVIIKSDGWPTYHLANVIDDHELGITDVVRAEEWVPSTPKHLAMYKAFGWNPPRFAHMSHIIGSDRTKLSKRHGDTAILDYKDKGYLPSAILNFLATLGWTDGTEKEIFTKEELMSSFDIQKVSKSPAVFDIDKLNWINAQYIRQLDLKELKEKTEELLPDLNLLKSNNFDKILEVEKSRLTTILDIQLNTDFYIQIGDYEGSLLIFKKSTAQDTKTGLKAATEALKVTQEHNSIDDYNEILQKLVGEQKISNGDVFWPVRVALSGKEKSPSPAELLWVLGKEESLKRIEQALNKI